MIEVGKKYKVSNLYKMRKFYEIFSNEKLYPLGTKLCWSHYRELLSLKNIDEINYYISITEQNNFTKRQLHERIKNNEYNRLSDDVKNKLSNNYKIDLPDMIPNPIIIKVNNQIEKLTEYALKELILNNLDEFLIQLGSGFTYVGNEYRIKYNSIITIWIYYFLMLNLIVML